MSTRVSKGTRVVIHIETDEDTAEKLCALLGGVRDISSDRELSSLYWELEAELLDREASFSDFFEGDVRMQGSLPSTELEEVEE